MPNWVGDFVMATPLLEMIGKTYPQARLTVLCQSPLEGLIQKDPAVDEVFVFNKKNKSIRRNPKKSIVEKLKLGKYDLGILTTNSFSSAWWFYQGKVKERIGYKTDMRSVLLTKPITPFKDKHKTHLVTVYKKLLEPLGILNSPTSPKLYIEEGEKLQAYDTLNKYGVEKSDIIIGVNPGAAYGSAKCWPKERFRAVVEKLLTQEKVKVVFFGDTSSEDLVKEICRDLPKKAVNLAGVTSLRDLMALISVCNVFLTNDSGPMHIADAIGTEVVALFGSTNPIATAPYNQKDAIIYKGVSCSPCYKRVCPIDFRCMTEISPNEVYEKILEKLKKQKLL